METNRRSFVKAAGIAAVACGCGSPKTKTWPIRALPHRVQATKVLQRVRGMRREMDSGPRMRSTFTLRAPKAGSAGLRRQSIVGNTRILKTGRGVVYAARRSYR